MIFLLVVVAEPENATSSLKSFLPLSSSPRFLSLAPDEDCMVIGSGFVKNGVFYSTTLSREVRSPDGFTAEDLYSTRVVDGA